MAQKYNYRTSYHNWTWTQQWLPNPDIVLKRRGQSIAIYRELLSDSHLAACLSSRAAVPMGHDWALVENGCPKRIFKAIQDWFVNILDRKTSTDDISREELIDNLMDVVYWGYQPAELIWDFVGGFWMPVNVVPKPPEWFGWFIPNSGVPEFRFYDKDNPIEGTPPPDEYTLICPRVKPSYENPYGKGVAGKCFWPIVFKRAGMEFWLNFMERFAQPWVVGKANTTDSTQLTTFRDDLAKLVQDAVVVVSGTDKTVELLETKTGKDNGFKELCNFMDSQVSKAVLGHTLSTDSADKGSYAATRGAMDVRSDIGVKDTKMIKAVLNDVINLIMLRNGFVNQPRPSARPFHEDQVDLVRAERDEAVSRIGVRFSKDYFTRTYGYQERDIKEIVDPAGKQVTGIKPPKDTMNTPGGLEGKDKGGGGNA